MPVTSSAKKKMRVDARRRVHNIGVRSRMRAAIKKAEASKKFADVAAAYSAIDRAVKAKITHANLAARQKSKLSRLAKPIKLAAAAVKPTGKPVKPAVKKSPAKKISAKKTPTKKSKS